MKAYVLNYYPSFRCVAGDCKHTCCAGWDMYIDGQTLNAYKHEGSCFGDQLKKGVNFKKGKFKADKAGRCVFLNKKGLCEIILHLGEDRLCEVCKKHPRFINRLPNGVETGLDFCCEQATKIILSQKERIERVEAGQDSVPEQAPDFLQEQVLKFRETALKTLQDRSVPLALRIQNLLSLCKASVKGEDFHKIVKAFLRLERLDKAWGNRLSALKKGQPSALKKHAQPVDFSLGQGQDGSRYAEQFLCNQLYRHLSDAEDTLWVRARTVACVLSWWLIAALWEAERKEGNAPQTEFETLCDIVRAYSADVEYSQKNLNKLYRFARTFINL